MKKIINGKMYDTDNASVVAKKDHYNYNNNYSGTTRIMVTKKGNLFSWTNSNGQDLYLQDSIDIEIDIDDMTIVNEELAKKYELFEEA
jgi:hypothetical protein